MSHLSSSIGYEIKRIRREKNMTQAELCEGICSQAEISKVENGKNSPTIDWLQQVAKRLKVPLSMLFEDHLRSDMYTSYDQQLLRLLQGHQFEEACIIIDDIKNKIDYDEIKFLAMYYEIIIHEKRNFRTYLETISEFKQLLMNTSLQFKSPTLYLRIKMAIAISFIEHEKFDSAEKNFQELLQFNFDTIELKKVRIKILYNYAKQLSEQNRNQIGLEVTEQGIQESLQIEDGQLLGQLYYQRGYFKKKLNGNPFDIQRDFTMAYSLFRTFNLSVHEKILLEKNGSFVLFRV
ncbi:helix-turn-helix domain-containing protein [Exiguobacterium acetylicum]